MVRIQLLMLLAAFKHVGTNSNRNNSNVKKVETNNNLNEEKLKTNFETINCSSVNNYEINYKAIDEIIAKNAEAKKSYSKTYIESNYTPLSLTDKMKFVDDLHQLSDKRLSAYSELFNQIKCQISIISDNMPSFSNNLNHFKNQNNVKDSYFNENDQGEYFSNEEISFNNDLIFLNHKKSPNKKSSFSRPELSLNKESCKNSMFLKRRSKSIIELDYKDCDEKAGNIFVPKKYYKSNKIQGITLLGDDYVRLPSKSFSIHAAFKENNIKNSKNKKLKNSIANSSHSKNNKNAQIYQEQKNNIKFSFLNAKHEIGHINILNTKDYKETTVNIF